MSETFKFKIMATRTLAKYIVTCMLKMLNLPCYIRCGQVCNVKLFSMQDYPIRKVKRTGCRHSTSSNVMVKAAENEQRIVICVVSFLSLVFMCSSDTLILDTLP